jgi:uncharacterized protein YutD
VFELWERKDRSSRRDRASGRNVNLTARIQLLKWWRGSLTRINSGSLQPFWTTLSTAVLIIACDSQSTIRYSTTKITFYSFVVGDWGIHQQRFISPIFFLEDPESTIRYSSRKFEFCYFCCRVEKLIKKRSTSAIFVVDYIHKALSDIHQQRITSVIYFCWDDQVWQLSQRQQLSSHSCKCVSVLYIAWGPTAVVFIFISQTCSLHKFRTRQKWVSWYSV